QPHRRQARGSRGGAATVPLGGKRELASAVATEAAIARARTASDEPAATRPWLVVVSDGVMPPADTLELLRLRRGCRITILTLAESQQSEPSAVDLRLRLESGGVLPERTGEEEPVAEGQADRLGRHAAEALA